MTCNVPAQNVAQQDARFKHEDIKDKGSNFPFEIVYVSDDGDDRE